jgi:hypothetical protein
MVASAAAEWNTLPAIITNAHRAMVGMEANPVASRTASPATNAERTASATIIVVRLGHRSTK